jgi:hypothetical protein
MKKTWPLTVKHHGSNFFLWVWIVDHYQQVLTANLALALLISLVVYARSFLVKPGNPQLRELARGGQTGSIILLVVVDDPYPEEEVRPVIVRADGAGHELDESG